MCGGCFGEYENNTQLALHLAADKTRSLYECDRSPASSSSSSSSVVEEVVSVQAADAANADVAGAAAAAIFVLTAEKIAASHQAAMKTMAAEREAERLQIMDTFKTRLAFVQNINKTCGRPVTREDAFKRQRWDLQAMKQDRLRRKEEKKDDEDEEEEDEEEEDKGSSSSSEEEVEADKGVAHEGQLTSAAQVAQVVMSIEFCQNTEASQQSDARGRWRLRRR
jgi:hypothetical protein